MKSSLLLLVAAVALLLLADALAFHDLFESHTVRDWMMLAGSALAAISLAARARALQPVLVRRADHWTRRRR